ncbi:unnamed protein product, partial [Didymodactylos carnosus]
VIGGPVRDEYRFLQFHMHWGPNELEGSEHVVDGSRYPAELHIVNWNTTKYSTPQAAATSENFDGLMVFGILIRASSEDNPVMEKLFQLLAKVPHKGDKTNIDSVLAIDSLLPKDTYSYYTYDGSLTTPMCNESVKWVVFKEKVSLSRRQLDQLRHLKHCSKNDVHGHSNIHLNYRPVMPLNEEISLEESLDNMALAEFDFPPAPPIEEENELNSKLNNLTITVHDPYDNNSNLTQRFPSPPLPPPPAINSLSKGISTSYNSKTLAPIKIRPNEYNKRSTHRKRHRTSSSHYINNHKNITSNGSLYVNLIANNNVSNLVGNIDVAYATLMNVSSNNVSKSFDNTPLLGQNSFEHATYQELEHCIIKNENFSNTMVEQLKNSSSSSMIPIRSSIDQGLSIIHSSKSLYQNITDAKNGEQPRHKKTSIVPLYENNINACSRNYANVVFLKQSNDVSCISTTGIHEQTPRLQNEANPDEIHQPLFNQGKRKKPPPPPPPPPPSLLEPIIISTQCNKALYVNLSPFIDNIEAPSIPTRKPRAPRIETMIKQNSNEERCSMSTNELYPLVNVAEKGKKESVSDNLPQNSTTHTPMSTLSGNKDLNSMDDLAENNSTQQELCTELFRRFEEQVKETDENMAPNYADKSVLYRTKLKNSPVNSQRGDKSMNTIINPTVCLTDGPCRLPLHSRRRNQNIVNRRRRMQGMRGNILKAAGKRHPKLSIRGDKSSIRHRNTLRGTINLSHAQLSQNMTSSIGTCRQSTLQQRLAQSKRRAQRMCQMKSNQSQDNTETLDLDVDHTYNEIKHFAIQNFDDSRPSSNMNSRSLGVLGRAMQFNGALRDRVFSWYRSIGNEDEQTEIDNNSKENTISQQTNTNENQSLSIPLIRKFKQSRSRSTENGDPTCTENLDDEEIYTHDHFILRRRPHGSTSTVSVDLQDENESIRRPSTQLQRQGTKTKETSSIAQKPKSFQFQNVLSRSHQLLSNQRSNIALSKISSLSSKSYGNIRHRKQARSSHLQLTLDKKDVDFIHGILNKTKEHNQAWNRVRALKEAYIRASTKTKTLSKKQKSKLVQNSVTTKVKCELEKYDELPSAHNNANNSCYNSEDNIDNYEFDEEEEEETRWIKSHRGSMPVISSTVNNIKPKLINFVSFLKRKAEINIKNLQKNFTEIKHRMHQEHRHRLELQLQKGYRSQDIIYPSGHYPLERIATLGGGETEETNCEDNVSVKDKHLSSRVRNHRIKQDHLRMNTKHDSTAIIRKSSNISNQRPMTSMKNVSGSPRHCVKRTNSHHISSRMIDQQVRSAANNDLDPSDSSVVHAPVATHLKRHTSSIAVQNRPTKNHVIVRRSSVRQSSREHKPTSSTTTTVQTKADNDHKYRLMNHDTSNNSGNTRRKRHSTKLTDMQTS